MPDSAPSSIAAQGVDFPDAEFYAKIGWLARTLKQRNFGEKHFDEMENLLAQIDARLIPDKQSKSSIRTIGSNLSDRAVISTFTFFRQRGPRYCQPCYLSMSMSDSAFGYSEIPLPLLIRSESHHFRRTQRSADQYASEGLAVFLGMTLALSKVLEDTPAFEKKLKSDQGMRVFLSDPMGLYLCRAQKLLDHEIDPQLIIARERKDARYCVFDPTPAWVPSVKITAYSHVQQKGLYRDNAAIFEELDEFQQDTDIQKALSALHLRFANPGACFDKAAIDENISALKKINQDGGVIDGDPHEARANLEERIATLKTLARGDGYLVGLVTQLSDIVNGTSWARPSQQLNGGAHEAQDRLCLRPPETSKMAALQLNQINF